MTLTSVYNFLLVRTAEHLTLWLYKQINTYWSSWKYQNTIVCYIFTPSNTNRRAH